VLANQRADGLVAANAARLQAIADDAAAAQAAADAAAQLVADREQAARDRAAEIEAARVEALEAKAREAEAKKQAAAARTARLNGNMAVITAAVTAMKDDKFVFPAGPLANLFASIAGASGSQVSALAPLDVEASAASEVTVANATGATSKKRKTDSDDEHADVFPLGKRPDKAAAPTGQAGVLQVWGLGDFKMGLWGSILFGTMDTS